MSYTKKSIIDCHNDLCFSINECVGKGKEITMIPHAVLCLVNGNGQYFAVPVTNFPIVPIGSEVSFWINERVFFEVVMIERYVVDSRYGVQIDLEYDNEGRHDRAFGELQKLCIKDKNGSCEFVYPGNVDFGAKYPSA